MDSSLFWIYGMLDCNDTYIRSNKDIITDGYFTIVLNIQSRICKEILTDMDIFSIYSNHWRDNIIWISINRTNPTLKNTFSFVLHPKRTTIKPPHVKFIFQHSPQKRFVGGIKQLFGLYFFKLSHFLLLLFYSSNNLFLCHVAKILYPNEYHIDIILCFCGIVKISKRISRISVWHTTSGFGSCGKITI